MILLPAADGGTILWHAEPQAVAGALAHAARRAAWLSRPVGAVPELEGIGTRRAHEITEEYLAVRPDGGRLDPCACAELLDCYAFPQIP
ncbi:hypothetical protein [Streptomyces anandii]|uniref:hypothetical protein n=1 Tax=Streptomyces anandii TaxID=285454 RepID=UPI0037B6CB40